MKALANKRQYPIYSLVVMFHPDLAQLVRDARDVSIGSWLPASIQLGRVEKIAEIPISREFRSEPCELVGDAQGTSKLDFKHANPPKLQCRLIEA